MGIPPIISKRQVHSANSLFLARKKRKCLIIAEVAQAHDGSLGMAHAFIDAVAKTGASGIKFQTHIANEESTIEEPWRIKFSLQDETRYDYWKRMEFTEPQWLGLMEHATESGLLFLSSPFSIKAFEMLSRVGVAAWKIASGEIDNEPLIQRMVESGLPLILSTGMSSLEEIDNIVNKILCCQKDLTILQCTSEYPCNPESWGLNMLSTFRSHYGCCVGFSDHSGDIFAGLAAAVLGAEMIEVHITFSKDMFGPDAPASITPAELQKLVQGVAEIERAIGNPVEKSKMASKLSQTRAIFSKSVVTALDLRKGTVLNYSNLALKKPGIGLSPRCFSELIGKKLTRDLSKDSFISESDFE